MLFHLQWEDRNQESNGEYGGSIVSRRKNQGKVNQAVEQRGFQRTIFAVCSAAQRAAGRGKVGLSRLVPCTWPRTSIESQWRRMRTLRWENLGKVSNILGTLALFPLGIRGWKCLCYLNGPSLNKTLHVSAAWLLWTVWGLTPPPALLKMAVAGPAGRTRSSSCADLEMHESSVARLIEVQCIHKIASVSGVERAKWSAPENKEHKPKPWVSESHRTQEGCIFKHDTTLDKENETLRLLL